MKKCLTHIIKVAYIKCRYYEYIVWRYGMKNEETKREKFVRIAEARTNKIINMIQFLGNCSNQSLYEYSQKDVNKIFNTIQTELDEAKKRYSKQDSQKGSKFTLD